MKNFFKRIIRNFIILIAFIVLVITAIYAMRVKIIEAVIELKGSSANGAIVEIEGLSNPLFTLDVSWDRMQVADKKDYMKNAYEINKGSFKMIPKPLLAGKFIIDELKIDEVLLATPREESGELPDELKPSEDKTKDNNEIQSETGSAGSGDGKAQEDKGFLSEMKSYFGDTAKEKVNETLTFDDFDSESFADNLEKEFDLKFQSEIKKADDNLMEKQEYWDAIIEERGYEDRIQNLEKDYKALNLNTSKLKSLFKDIKDIKSLKRFEDEFKKLETEKERMESLIKEGKSIKSEIEKDKKKFKEDIVELEKIEDDLKESFENDLNNLKAVGELSRDELQELALRLFGEKITNILFTLYDVYDKINGIFGDKKESEENNKKEAMPELPRLWIKKTDLNIYNNDDKFTGIITDISDNQNKTQKPIVIDLKNETEEEFTELNSVIDFRGDNNLKKLEIKQEGMILRNESLGFAEIGKADTKGNAQITVLKNQVSVGVDIELSNIEFVNSKQSGNDVTNQIYSEVINDTEIITVNLDYNDGKFDIKSNLSGIFAEKLDQAYKDELEKAENKAKKNIRKTIEKQLNSYLSNVSGLDKKVGNSLINDKKDADGNYDLVTEKEKKLDEEMEKLDDEKDEKLKSEEEKVKKKLKKYFNF